MSTTELRRRAKKLIDTLPPAHVRIANSFLTYLDGQPVDDADLQKIVRMEHRLARSERDIRAGRTVNWRKVRRDV